MSKIAEHMVEDLFARQLGFRREKVLQGPGYGVDCALIELSDKQAMAVASDPLSFIPSIGVKESAYISVHLAANDIATTGCSPQYGQFVLNLPASISERQLKEYWYYINEFSAEIGLHITGGHTGFDAHQDSTIVGAVTMFAIGERDNLLLSSQAQVGDVLLMTKSAGLIATSVLAMSFSNHVKTNLGADILDKLISNFWDISVLREASLVREINVSEKIVHAMHDVTEGGVLGAIYEMATASDIGVKVVEEAIIVNEEVTKTANFFGLDATKIIGAGSMLIACSQNEKHQILEKIRANHIQCTEIGYFCPKEEGMYVLQNNKNVGLKSPGVDKYWEVFAKCIQDGLS
ncbi:MAG: AIR synthase-related protein [Sphingobacterium composti]